VFGRLAAGESRAIRGHAAACAICGRALRREESVLQRLEALRKDEPRIDVLGRVLDRLDEVKPQTPRAEKSLRVALVALSVVAGALVLVSAARSRVLRARLSRAW
jgi:hypothetical protein